MISSLPYPGLRPFTREETDIFFGREEHTDELLEILGRSHFLAVLGPSGCGKSSLVRAGMLSALETGFISSAGARWRVADMRPGDRPLTRLAAALMGETALEHERQNEGDALAFLSATLRRGPLGLIEVLRETPLPPHTNLLVFVDQFEEIFRFRDKGTSHRDESDAFVAMLLDTAAQREMPVYVAITMRSDYLGHCAVFAGLPEAMNQSQYLTPRLTREQRQSAIVGPAKVFDADIEPTLTNRLLNDMGSDPNQLPLMQHVLMRMWQRLEARPSASGHRVLTLADYEATGGLAMALSNHADEAWHELATGEQRRIAEVMFRRLTERSADQRDTRRPAPLSEVAAVAGVSWEQVAEVVDAFRRPDRSFVTPRVGETLYPNTRLDITHESLISNWQRLDGWAQTEAKSAETYRLLEQSARRWKAGQSALWGTPDLDLALSWKQTEHPTAMWAERYAPAFDLAMTFLDESKAARDRDALEREQQLMERRRMRRRQLVAARIAAGVLLILLTISLASLRFMTTARDEAFAQRTIAEQERQRAQEEAARARSAEQESARQSGFARDSEARALVDRATAEEQSAKAQAAADLADNERREAERQAAIAAEQRQVAEAQREQAETAGKAALTATAAEERARRSAEASEALAVANFQKANQLQYVALSRALAGEAMRPSEASDVPALLARQAYNFAATYGGDPESPEIVTALRQSLEGIATDTTRVLVGHDDAVRALAVSPNGTTLATTGDDGRIRLFPMETQASSPIAFASIDSPVRAIAFDATGNRLAVGTLSGVIRVWSVVSPTQLPKLVKSWPAHTSAVNYLSFESHGNLVSVGLDGLAQVWDGNTFAARASWKNQSRFLAAALSHRGTRLAVATDGDGILLRDLDSSADSPIKLGGSRRITAVAFSEDERWLLAGTGGGQILYWDLRAGTPAEREVSVHRAAITALRFGGGRLASAALDGEVKVWAANPEALGRPPLVLTHGGWVWALAFDESGNHLFSAGADGRVRMWPVSGQLLADEICRRVGRKNLSRDEWDLYLSTVPYALTCPGSQTAGGRP
jgi:WD40 repeat protein/energy-coupling factor transporter ATP-binding protein EcfA2